MGQVLRRNNVDDNHNNRHPPPDIHPPLNSRQYTLRQDYRLYTIYFMLYRYTYGGM